MTAKRAAEMANNANHDESTAGTFKGIEGMSGELYSHLVAATTDGALGVVTAVLSGDGIEAWTELYKRYNQRTMSRTMRVLMECMYPKGVKVAELGAATLQLKVREKE